MIEHPTLYIATRAERDAQRFTLAPPTPTAPSAAELRWRPEVAGRGAPGISHLVGCMLHVYRTHQRFVVLRYAFARLRCDHIGRLGVRRASARGGLHCTAARLRRHGRNAPTNLQQM